MEQELTLYNEERTRQFASLLEKQRQDLAQIDSEITHLGINLDDLVDSMQDVHLFPNDNSTTDSPNHPRASMMSFPHSISSNAFLSNPSNTNGNNKHD